MNLKLSARGDEPKAMVHLAVIEPLHTPVLTRYRGQALCRPDIPNLESLNVQILGERRCCPRCVAVMEKVRRVRKVQLPPSCGLVAGDLIKAMREEQQKSKPQRPKRTALSAAESARSRPSDT